MRKLSPAPVLTLAAFLAVTALSACGGAAGAASHGHAASGGVGSHARTHAQAGPSGKHAKRPAGNSRSGGGAHAAAHGKPLAGKIVGIDPGHNGHNNQDPSYINRKVWNGREWEACDTTGTETNAGYTEPRFTFRVAKFLRADLVADGAKVVMTRTNNHGVGPCVNRRAKILNRAHSNVAIDIHADGGPAWGRGFSILEPVRDGPNNKIVAPAKTFGRDVRSAVRKHTPMPISNYYGHDGLQPRDDLAGLNLATEPKVLIESGNMRNGTDARLLTSASFQRRLARALTDAIVAYLR